MVNRMAGVSSRSSHATSLDLFLVLPLRKIGTVHYSAKEPDISEHLFLSFHLYEVQNETKLVFNQNGRVERTAWEGT